MLGLGVSVPKIAVLDLLNLGLPIVGGVVPTLFADLTSEGLSNRYVSGVTRYPGFASWVTGLGATYGRASPATYLQGGVVKTALTNVARFGTDINGLPTGLHFNPGGTNVHLQSQQFGAAWTTQGSALTPNAATAPDGTLTAATFVPTATTSGHNIFLSAGVNRSASGTDVFSLYVKAAGYNFVYADPENLGTNGAYFGITGAGSVVSVQGTAVASITALANGWYRLSIAYMATGVTNIDPIIYASINGITHTGITTDGTSGYQVWGFQYEKGVAFATDYIPTTTVTVTQSPDLFVGPTAPWLTVPTSGMLFSSGSMGFTDSQSFITFNDASNNYSTTNGLLLRGSNTSIHSLEVGGNATAATAASAGGQLYKAAGAFDVPSTTARIVTDTGSNSSIATLDYTGTGTVTKFNIGKLATGNIQPFIGDMKSVGYIPLFASVAQCSAFLAQLP